MSPDKLTDKALERIAGIMDPRELRNIARNAKRLGNDQVETAALRRLYWVSPEAEPGTLEHDVWQTIHALEGILSDERGKTTRLSRTRQKIAKDGEVRTVSDLVQGPPAQGYLMLVERKLSELTFEAVCLRHPKVFSEQVRTAAQRRLATLKADRAPG